MSELWARCERCEAVFKVLDLPRSVDEFCDAMKAARCPQCGADMASLRLASKAEAQTAQWMARGCHDEFRKA